MAEAVQSVTLKLPESLYRRAQRAAAQKQRPLKEVIIEAVDAGLSAVPEVEAKEGLPPELAAELAAMEQLSEAELWRIGQEVMPAGLRRRFRALQSKNAAGTISPRERQRLQELLYESERINLRKARAYALLSERGVKLPAVEELPVPR